MLRRLPSSCTADLFVPVLTTGGLACPPDAHEEDKLTGGSGRDWFLARITGQHKDKITDLLLSELVDQPT